MLSDATTPVGKVQYGRERRRVLMWQMVSTFIPPASIARVRRLPTSLPESTDCLCKHGIPCRSTLLLQPSQMVADADVTEARQEGTATSCAYEVLVFSRLVLQTLQLRRAAADHQDHSYAQDKLQFIDLGLTSYVHTSGKPSASSIICLYS